jgi:hypothetical protein
MNKPSSLFIIAMLFFFALPVFGNVVWGAYLDVTPASYDALLDEEFH